MRRVFSLACAVLICCSLALPVSAASASGSADVVFNNDIFHTLEFPRTNASAADWMYSRAGPIALSYINVPPAMALNLSGSVGVYFSYYTVSNSAIRYYLSSTLIDVEEYKGYALDPTSWQFLYYDNLSREYSISYDDCYVYTFSPSNDSYSNKSVGLSYSFKFDPETPAQGFYFKNLLNLRNGPTSGDLRTYIPSFSVITTETPEDLTQLEDIANGIAEGNDIAMAMYGDIMEALNSIKGDTSVMAECIQEALTALLNVQTYTNNIYSLCSSYLHYLADIARTSESIDDELKAYHTDFMSMMNMLNGTIIDESENIQAKMEEIYGLLIAYLDSQYAGAVNPNLEQSTGNAQTDIDIQHGLEQGFQSNLTASWTDLKLQSFALGGGYTSAMAWVSSWFTNFYNAMGDYGMIVLLPLFLGIVTLVTGLRRQAFSRGSRAPHIPPLPTDPMLPPGRGK